MTTRTLPRSPSPLQLTSPPSSLTNNTSPPPTSTSPNACATHGGTTRATSLSPSSHSCCSDHSTRRHDRRTRRTNRSIAFNSIGPTPTRTTTTPTDTTSVEEVQNGNEIQSQVRQIMRSDITSNEKALRIHQLFAAQRQAIATKLESKVERGVFPGRGAQAGCDHYKRKCWILAPCCNRYYPCRRCHDEAENHQIDRHSIAKIACVVCGDKDQPVAETCRTCDVRFARYFCAPCRLYNDDDSVGRTAYHCDKCGICRVGLGLGIDYHHCDECNTCVPVERIHDHPCRERNLDANCPICHVHLATSTEDSYFLPCSHAIHVECLEQYMKAGNFTCPLCSKCFLNKVTMQKWYKTLEERLKLDQMPPEFEHRVCRVLCNDCEVKSVTKFHFRFHRCDKCHGFNTKVLEQWDTQPPRVMNDNSNEGDEERNEIEANETDEITAR